MKHIMRFLAFGMVAATAFSTAEAVPLEDRGTITFDPNTGLEWLDVSATANRSFDDVQASLLGPGQPYAGFRYATRSEVETLFQNAGIANFANHGADHAIAALVEMLGATFFPGPGFGGLGGMTGDESPLDSSFVIVMVLLSGNDMDNNSYAGPDGILAKALTPPADTYGSFLVRQNFPEMFTEAVPEVLANPVPPSFLLFVGGLGTIGYLAMRRRRRGS